MCTLKIINWYGMALPYQICTWSGSCHTLTTTSYFDWLACSHHCKSLEVKVANGNKIPVISDHYCVGYVRSSQRPRVVAVLGKP